VTSTELVYETASRGYRVLPNGDLVNCLGRRMSSWKDNNGYMRFTVRYGGPGVRKTKSVRIHRLHAYQLFGDQIFNKGMCVRHLDGDATNNAESNLAIGTHSDNMMDIPKQLRMERAKYASTFVTKFDHRGVVEFYVDNGWKATLEHFSMSKGNLSYILKKFRQPA
jgi:hypothetical protein